MPSESKHTLGTFEHALENLRNNVMMMASQTERSLNRALKGLMERDDELAALALGAEAQHLALVDLAEAGRVVCPRDSGRRAG